MNARQYIIESIYKKRWSQAILFNPLSEYHQYRLRRFIGRAAKSLGPTQRVIDVGAGELKYKMYFVHCDYLSVDLCIGDDVWDYRGVDVVASAFELPIRDETFDAVLCIQVLEHLNSPARAFAEFHRILRPGGRVFVSFPLLAGEHQQPFDFFRYTQFGLKFLAESTGFRVVSIEPHGGSIIALEILAWSAFWALLPIRRQTLPRYILYVVLYPVKVVTGLVALLLDSVDRDKSATINYDAVLERR